MNLDTLLVKTQELIDSGKYSSKSYFDLLQEALRLISFTEYSLHQISSILVSDKHDPKDFWHTVVNLSHYRHWSFQEIHDWVVIQKISGKMSFKEIRDWKSNAMSYAEKIEKVINNSEYGWCTVDQIANELSLDSYKVISVLTTCSSFLHSDCGGLRFYTTKKQYFRLRNALHVIADFLTQTITI